MNFIKKIDKHIKIDAYLFYFWILIIIGILFISSSYPMMKIKFDVWQHIGDIDNLVHNSELKIGRSNWHKVWAFIFRSLNIHNIYEYALVIHRVQFFLNCLLIYITSQQLCAALLSHFGNEKNEKNWVSSLALSSVLVWLTVIGTMSTFQQAWIMWYSVNYQITLTFILCAVAMCVNVLVLDQAKHWILIKLSIAFALIFLTYLFHAGELAYLLVYLIFLFIFFAKKNKLPQIIIAIIIFLIASCVATTYYVDRVPELVTLIGNKNYSKIQSLISEYGNWNVEGGNRYLANWNELYFFSASLGLPVLILAYIGKNKVNKNVLYFILASLIFCFIPTFSYSSGIASLIVGFGIVNRLYFASYIFLLIPVFIYMLIIDYRPLNKPVNLIAIVCILLVIVYMYSKEINNQGVFYKNIKSIKNSLDSKLVGVDISSSKVGEIKRKIEDAEFMHGVDNIIFCSNYDVGHIVKYQFRRTNIYFDRFSAYNLQDCLNFAKNQNKISIVIN